MSAERGAWDDPAVRQAVRETIAAERGPSGTGHDTRHWVERIKEAERFDAETGFVVPGDSALAVVLCGMEESAYAGDPEFDSRVTEAAPAPGPASVPADPVVSPADTPERDERLLRAIAAADRAATSMTPYGPMNDKWMSGFLDTLAAEGLAIVDAALLAVGERDKAAELGPVPTDAGGTGKEETYWLTQKLKASIRHLRDIEDYYRPMGGRFSEERADRARVLYEQITADFLHGKLDVPPEIVALREAGERDRQQIARLTEALREIAKGELWTGDVTELAAAVLADEEDAGL